jgi:hypothetical protein
MDVEIIESKTNKVIGVFSISLMGGNYHPSYEELYQEAWRCAVDDKLVDANKRKAYSFKVIEK